jgi:hypothetical protein
MARALRTHLQETETCDAKNPRPRSRATDFEGSLRNGNPNDVAFVMPVGTRPGY